MLKSKHQQKLSDQGKSEERKKYAFSEEGFVLLSSLAITIWTWYLELFGSGLNKNGMMHRRFGFLESVFGEYYIPILATIGTLVVAFVVWRKGIK